MSKKIDSFSVIVGNNRLPGSIWSELDEDFMKNYLIRNVDQSATKFLEALKEKSEVDNLLDEYNVIDLGLLFSTVANITDKELKTSLENRLNTINNKCVNGTFSILGKENFVTSRYSNDNNGIYIYTNDIKTFKSWILIGKFEPDAKENNSLSTGGIEIDNIVGQKFKIGFGKATFSDINSNDPEVFKNLPEFVKIQVYLTCERFYDNDTFTSRIDESNEYFKSEFSKNVTFEKENVKAKKLKV